MLNKIIRYSLEHRLTILVCAVAIAAAGLWSLYTMRVDILPEINKPTVTVFAEADGLAAEEVEKLIANPVESSLLGAPGVERVRGIASFGLAIVNVEFGWGTDNYRDRQIVQERLNRVRLPSGVTPTLGPVSSIIGEIVWAGLTSQDQKTSGMDLRTIADWTIRPALLKVPGVSDVIIMGGDIREWQLSVNTEQLQRYGLHLEDIKMAVQGELRNRGGGILDQGAQEYPIRIMAAPEKISDLGETAIGRTADGRVLYLREVAQLVEGPKPVRGTASVNGAPGVVLRIVKQPDAETLQVTKAIDQVLASVRPSLPEGVSLTGDLFRQEWFIEAGLGNVRDALRDSTILVIIVLALFLFNVRTTAITLTAIPLSIFVSAIVFRAMGLSVNVMTLGGIAIAIGELVDDAIVDLENVFRKLREWRAGDRERPASEVIFKASSEVRNSIVYATLLVGVVFLPIFFLPGVEGRLLAPLGAAYLISLIASLAVSLTVTPALCSYLLSAGVLKKEHGETRFAVYLKDLIGRGVRVSIAHPKTILAIALVAISTSVGLYLLAGKEGIPPFNEGSATAIVELPVGASLPVSNAYATRVEEAIRSVPGVSRVSHITGRAGTDAHESGSNFSEMQIIFEPGMENQRERLFQDIQKVLDRFRGAQFSLGQPITHRVEMLLSGVEAPVVIKVFGDDQNSMRDAANLVLKELQGLPGMKNPKIQKDLLVPEFRIYLDRNRLAETGTALGPVAEELEMGLMGMDIGQVRLGSAWVDVVARYDTDSRGSGTSLRDLSLPFVGVGSLAGGAGDLQVEPGFNRVSHEAGKRVLTVSANYQGRNIVGDIDGVRQRMERQKLPAGVTLSYEGTYRSQQESSRTLAFLFGIGLVIIFGILYRGFHSVPVTLLVMLNIPTAFLGGMVAIWLSGGVINLAHLVGFVSLAGIVSRNGIMLIGRALSLLREGHAFEPATIERATRERVVPVLMTSFVTALALVPLLFAGGAPGKELLHPLAVVIFGGLISSTAISFFLTPTLFYRFGRSAIQAKDAGSGF